MESNIFNPTIPFIGPLPSSLHPGNLIRIAGTANSDATCFSINLQSGNNSYQRSDIALHLSPVFSSPPRVVRNSLENQQWGPEESHGSNFPFSSQQGFEIMILAEADHFKIAINGAHFTEFHYRQSLQSISHIAVDGDVSINSIKFEGLAKSPSMLLSPDTGEGISKPLGFVIDSSDNTTLSPPGSGGRPSSPYGGAGLPYPTSFGPSPTSYAPPTGAGYAPSSPSSPYGPYPTNNPYGPPSGRVSPSPYGPPPSGRVSPSPYGPPPSGRVSPSPYGPPPSAGGYNYGPPHGGAYPNPQGYPQQSGYPQGYPQQSGYPQGYPQQSGYPSQPGPYPGTSVVYPGQEKKSEGGGMGALGGIAAASAAALAGVAGSSLLGGKHKKKHKKHGYGGMMGQGLGPAAVMGGVSSLLGGNKHGGHHKGSSGIPIGGAVAGGATALAGAYMMNKVLKPKKMFKHKHKMGGWGGFGSSSSSSSSDEE